MCSVGCYNYTGRRMKNFGLKLKMCRMMNKDCNLLMNTHYHSCSGYEKRFHYFRLRMNNDIHCLKFAAVWNRNSIHRNFRPKHSPAQKIVPVYQPMNF